MPSIKKLLTAAAGSAGGDPVYVEDVFSNYLYTTDDSARTITNGIDLAGEGGLVWFKARNATQSHALFDSTRGNYVVYSNKTNAQDPLVITGGSAGSITLNNNGFSFSGGLYSGQSNINATTTTDMASWTFRKQPGFFDVVTYAGNGSTQAISHNLGSVPKMILVKSTDGAGQNWRVYHVSLGNTNFLSLNLTTDSTAGVAWNNTTPTDSVFSVGNGYNTNDNGFNYVAYLFGDDAIFGDDGDEAIVKCGTYTGNSSTPGPQVNCGFEPQLVLIKRTSAAAEWQILDNMRGVVTGNNDRILHPDTNSAEYPQNVIEFNATGFQPVGGSSNTNVGDYIYMAIRRGPMKEPSAGTDVFGMVQTNSDSSTTTGFPVNIGFPVDLANVTYTTLAAGYFIMDRFRGLTANPQPGVGMLTTYNTNAQTNTGELWGADSMTGYRIYGHNYQRICYGWRRYPKVFDIVTYTGNPGVAENHNLTVPPEFIITKEYAQAWSWYSWGSVLGANKYLTLDNSTAATSYTFNTTVTATTFMAGIASSGQPTVAYLFATLAGISKVGSVVHSGTTDVDCGFSGGARFVMVKRTDSTGDWYFWDTVRGIVAGDDPYLTYNNPAVQVYNTDYIDPLAAGFTLTSNFTAGTYIFLAFA